jgi:hypothetical protein
MLLADLGQVGRKRKIRQLPASRQSIAQRIVLQTAANRAANYGEARN